MYIVHNSVRVVNSPKRAISLFFVNKYLPMAGQYNYRQNPLFIPFPSSKDFISFFLSKRKYEIEDFQSSLKIEIEKERENAWPCLLAVGGLFLGRLLSCTSIFRFLA